VRMNDSWTNVGTHEGDENDELESGRANYRGHRTSSRLSA
jgi:hypothetical protein